MFIFSRTFDIITSVIGASIIAVGFAAVTAVADEAPASESARNAPALEQPAVKKANERILVLVPGLGVTATSTIPAMEVLASQD